MKEQEQKIIEKLIKLTNGGIIDWKEVKSTRYL